MIARKVIAIAMIGLCLAMSGFSQLVEYHGPSRMFGKKRTTPPVQFDPANRDLAEMQRLYREVYVPASEVPRTWNPGSGCDPGSLPQEVMDARIAEINYFRKMTGLCPVRTDSTFNRRCQAAASLMERRGDISNNPPADWPCFSQDAAIGASQSILGWNSNIMQFMRDYGTFSAHGFRQMLLYEPLEVIGYGATDHIEVLQCEGMVNDFHDSVPEFVAWPSAGYVPVEVAPDRWTFKVSYGGTDYRYASVHVYLDGKELPTEYYKTWGNDYYGLQWEIKDWYLWQEKSIDHKLLVKVNHVKVGGKMQFYEYEVRLFRGAT